MTKSLLTDDWRAPLMSAADVAHRLKMSLRTIRRKIALNELEVIRFGRTVRVAETALQAFIATRARR